MSSQTFERLIRLEDEELGSNEDIGDTYNNNIHSKDLCKVPMIPNDNCDTKMENLFPSTKFSHTKTVVNSPSGFNFVINGRHIQVNPEQLKYLSLITLTLQNAALGLTMRAARTQKEQFSASVAVISAELLKLVTCLILLWFEEVSLKRTWRTIKTNIIDNYIDTLKVAVPSFVYYVQNNLLYIGSTHLDAATAQVTYQLKILTTAIFSVTMLNKKLNRIQWISLIVLFIGVAVIESLVVKDHSNVRHVYNKNQTLKLITNSPQSLKKQEQPLLGFFAILIACCLSGFAGVYFEKILKNTAHISLWIRNIQLAIVTLPIGIIQLILIADNGDKPLFYGFTSLTWLCIILQAQGGLLVAVVVKFANNILKGFATSMAIVISTIGSIFLFDFNLTPSFVFGASLVISSIMIYNR